MPVSNHISVYTTSEKEEKHYNLIESLKIFIVVFPLVRLNKKKEFRTYKSLRFFIFLNPPSNYAFYSRLNIPFLKMGHFSVAN